jgi:uncharacterized protein GlcG (DUF336 family)
MHAEARVIIDEALAFSRQRMLMSVVVLDNAGGRGSVGRSHGRRFWQRGKAFASLNLRQTTEVLGDLAKTQPDRYFGIMSVYPGKVYLVGGGDRSSSTTGSSAQSGLPGCRRVSTRGPHG